MHQRLTADEVGHRGDDGGHLIRAPTHPITQGLAAQGDPDPLEGLLLAVEGFVLGVFLDHDIGHDGDVGLEAVVRSLRHDHARVTARAGHLGVNVLMYLVLNRQLVERLADILSDLLEMGMPRTVGTGGVLRIDRMFDPPPGKVRRQGSSAVWASLAFGAFQLGASPRLFGSGFGLLGLLLLRVGRGLVRAFALPDLLMRLTGVLGDACLQFRRADLLGARAEDAAREERDPVFEIPAHRLRVPQPSFQGGGVICRSCQRFPQALVLSRQGFRGGLRAHAHSLSRKSSWMGTTYTALGGTCSWRSRSPRLRPWVWPTRVQLLAA